MPLPPINTSSPTVSGPAENRSGNVNVSGGTTADFARLSAIAFGPPENGGWDFEAPRLSGISRQTAGIGQYVPILLIIGVGLYLWKRS